MAGVAATAEIRQKGETKHQKAGKMVMLAVGIACVWEWL
jgi:hypothetical protein